VGSHANPSDLASQDLAAKIPWLKNRHLSDKTLRLKFHTSTIADTELPAWDAVLWRGRLYVNVTAQQLSDGSKEAFVALLEFAEERLGCTHVVACLDKHLKGLKNFVRNFLFLGFQALTPGHEYLPTNPNLVRKHFIGLIIKLKPSRVLHGRGPSGLPGSLRRKVWNFHVLVPRIVTHRTAITS
jgi:hypothetical protein